MNKTFAEAEWAAALEVRAERAAQEFKTFVKTVAQLRHPSKGCPWDLEQTHESLRRYMLEEAYEAAETMLGESSEDLISELGDVLLQVVLNAQLAVDAGAEKGDIAAVVKGINEKMIRRHPHVFAPSDKSITADQVTEQWAAIKLREKPKAHAEGVFAKARKVHPALTQSFQIGKAAKKIDFDWTSTAMVFDQIQSEIKELQVEIKAGHKENIADELSDCFFSLAQLSRHLGHEPEEIAQRGNVKFLKRFDRIEAMAKERGLDVKQVGLQTLEGLWAEAKNKAKK